MMTLQEVLAWDTPYERRWQLVDGKPRAMSPNSRTLGTLQSELNRLIGNHLIERRSGCSIIANPGIVPRVRADFNYRVPDLGVTCSPYMVEEYGVTYPVLMIEVLSPSNKAASWGNVWT